VAESEILARIDRHLERSNELMDEVRREIDLTREEIRLSREERQTSREMFDDLREFIREITLRVERGGREMVQELRDLRAESQAQRQALLQLIDRMDRLDPGGSAA
jgi:Ribonuclease G/E